jgi:transposase InsO family protein
MRTASGITHYAHACRLLEKTYGTIAMPATIALEEDAELSNTQDTKETQPHVISDSEPEMEQNEGEIEEKENSNNLPAAPTEVTFDGVPGQEIQEEEHPEMPTAQQELLQWHLRLGHLSFARIQSMAKQGLLPRKLAHQVVPFCSGCAYGKMTRRPWRTKAGYNKTPKIATKPGKCVSIDQMDATVPGLIGQMAGGIPTNKRYQYATIFVDHYSRLGYIYLQQQLTSEETVQAKKAFETYAATYGVNILHYHADNGRFADKAFRQAISEKGQTISFCGVNAHWQNGVAERRIRELQENANTMLLHARRRWPGRMLSTNTFGPTHFEWQTIYITTYHKRTIVTHH